MIVHLFPYEKFTKQYVEFVNAQFDNNQHKFVIIDSKRELQGHEFNYYPNCSVWDNNIFSFKKIISNMDAMIIHSLFLPKHLLFYLAFYKKLNKTAWLIWGRDLHQDIIEFVPKNYRQKMSLLVRERIAKKVNSIITLTKEDYTSYNEYFRNFKTSFNVIYGNGQALKLLKEIDNIEIKNTNTYKILVGNSATRTNNHEEVFLLLEKYKDENIEVIVPLSYGEDIEYKNNIEVVGKKIFGDKFKPIHNFMDYREYLQLLSKMDVAIFNIRREQQGLGNIRALLYLGSKVYLHLDTSMGIEISNVCDIGNMAELPKQSFEELIFISNDSKKKNQNSITKIYDQSVAKRQWIEVFTYLTK